MRPMLVLATLLAAATAAHAEQAPHQAPDARAGKPGYLSLDINADGLITLDEAQTHPRFAARFGEIDANKDGQLDQAEMSAHREQMHAEMRSRGEERWKAADRDGDGSISRDEATASMPRMAERFGQFDANSDGRVSREEMRQVRGQHHQQRKEQHQRQEQSQRVR
jgi:Ca2+-binding EF-hand superfamily protein